MDSNIQDFIDTCNSDNTCNLITNSTTTNLTAASAASSSPASTSITSSSRYENQKRRDWNTFGQYLKNHRPPLSLSRCSGAHVLEFLRYTHTLLISLAHHAPLLSLYIFYKTHMYLLSEPPDNIWMTELSF